MTPNWPLPDQGPLPKLCNVDIMRELPVMRRNAGQLKWRNDPSFVRSLLCENVGTRSKSLSVWLSGDAVKISWGTIQYKTCLDWNSNNVIIILIYHPEIFNLRAISQEIHQLSLTTISLKITSLEFHSNLSEANELIKKLSKCRSGCFRSRNCLTQITITYHALKPRQMFDVLKTTFTSFIFILKFSYFDSNFTEFCS